MKSFLSFALSASLLLKRVSVLVFVGALIGLASASQAVSQSAPATKMAGGDMPELARPGALAVGTEVIAFDLVERPKITLMGAITGRLPLETRRLSVRLWYPAKAANSSNPARYRHIVKSPGKPDFLIDTPGIAVEGAPAIVGELYPLVVLSHGYRGWASHFSNLAEHLASRGYVVAAIDHNDASFDSATSFQMSFGNVMLDRAQDQRQIISNLIASATSPSASAPTPHASLAQIDTNKIALIGYSMGGFGALATAGAPYDTTSKTIKQMPEAAQTAMNGTSATQTNPIKALVVLAPWGGQPDNRSWSSEGLSKITAPVLMISGNQDDVVNFKDGVSWIFDHLTGTDRRLLVFQQARHNITGDYVPVTEDTDFSTLEFFSEPVWRTQRINEINQHFITAFLDLHLKNDTAKAAFLDVPAARADEGEWASGLGEQLGGRYAGDTQAKHWRGFQRRWVLGLEMKKANKSAAGLPTNAPTP